MALRVLAFFDTRFQSGLGLEDPWQTVRAARPASRQHPPLNWPGTFGAYDLASPGCAAALIGQAMAVGLDGFVVDVRSAERGYRHSADPLLIPCRDTGFRLSYRIRNDLVAASQWTAASATQLLQALPLDVALRIDGRLALVIERPDHVLDPKAGLQALRTAAQALGLGELYLMANQPDGHAALALGYDAALDPNPADWASAPHKNNPSGLDILEIQSGLRDLVELTDKFYNYALAAITRMAHRGRRGKVFARVFPSFLDWPAHPDGGATLVLARDGSAAVDRLLFGQFFENAITFTHENFHGDEQLVFLDSWNHWQDNSQIEPSTLDGDLVFDTAKAAIDKGRYMIRTRGDASRTPLPAAVQDRIQQISDAAAAVAALSAIR